MDCMETMSALALSVVLRECRQFGTHLTAQQGAEFLQSRILPHQNRGTLRNRDSEIAMGFQAVLARSGAPGIRTEADKKAAASVWLELAISCAKVSVKYSADEWKQQQKEKQAQQTAELALG